jgi:pimeloyl-ACP methyl ester carboxylesterase
MTLPSETRHSIRFAEIGPPVAADRTFLLLHGLGGSLDFWCAVAPSLGKVDRTLALDLPGFGKSAAPADGLTLESVTAATIEFCHTMNVKHCVVVAHSLGGFIGIKLAAMEPDLCRRLVLVDAAPVTAAMILRKPSLALKRPVLAATMAVQFLAGFVPLRRAAATFIAKSKLLRTLALWPFVAQPALLDPDITATALSHTGGLQTALRTFLQSRQVDILRLLDATSKPIDILRGDRDNMNTAADVAIVRQHADVRREFVVPNCRHWPPIESPKALVDFIIAAD